MTKWIIILVVLVAAGILMTAKLKSTDTTSVLVSSVEDLKVALKNAAPGDTILLKNGEWRDVELTLKGYGTAESPIVISAATPGQVKLTGHSSMRLGGEYLEVHGLHFTNGYTLTQEVIAFRIGADTLANHCRVTETLISNYSNPERQEKDYWVTMYGKHNRFDHNALVGKSNKGVTLAVRLNKEQSQHNEHLIDHNYFGPRPSLGSNGGETIRVGTSHYSLVKSNTTVTHNYFDRCSGEVEIVSNKSCGNSYLSNTFYESRGTLTLRHGNDNEVMNNVFLGNKVFQTGGIRVINKRQTVANNYLYGITGRRFYGALAIMNGVPNSPANRYHQVEDTELRNNSFIDCSHIELCVGSDQERAAVPKNTIMANNVFWSQDTSLIHIRDDISGLTFTDNLWSPTTLGEIGVRKLNTAGGMPRKAENGLYYMPELSENIGISPDIDFVTKEETGPEWYTKPEKQDTFDYGKTIVVSPQDDLYTRIQHAEAGDILELVAGTYLQSKTLAVTKPITIRSDQESILRFEKSKLFSIENGGSLKLEGLIIDGREAPDYSGNAVISTSRYSMTHNYRLLVDRCEFLNMDVNRSFDFLKAYKSTFADSIAIVNSTFTDFTGKLLALDSESEDEGIYNAEFVTLSNNVFKNIGKEVVGLYRGGRDESTFGPVLTIDACHFTNVGHANKNTPGSSIALHGVQKFLLAHSTFVNSGDIAIHHTGDAITEVFRCTMDRSKMMRVNDSNYRYKYNKVVSGDHNSI